MNLLDMMNKALATYELSGTDEDYAVYKAAYEAWTTTWTKNPYPYED